MSAILTRAALQYLTRATTRPMSSAATAGDHGGGYQLWKRLTFFVALPAIGLGVVNAVLAHQAGGHHRPEFVPYEYLRVRTKRFPWGDGNHSLFHNPHVNPLPTGYEDH